MFRVGGGTVWPMQGWHSATRIKNEKAATWDAAELGTRIKEELAKGITKPARTWATSSPEACERLHAAAPRRGGS